MMRDDTVRIAAGRTLPLPLVRVAGVVVAAASLLLVPLPYAVIVVCLAALGMAVPASYAMWAAIVVLAVARLTTPLAFDGRANLLLLIVHLMHVLGALALVLPWSGRIRVRALAAPARRWLVVQLPAQALVTLVVAASGLALRGVFPAGAVVIAAAVCVVVMVVVVAVLVSRRSR